MIKKLIEIMAACNKCAVLTGAGISAESNVPTFRGKDGLWGKFRAEELATMDAFMSNSKTVWEWYNWRRELIGKTTPNPGHYALVEMEKLFGTFDLITQNVDGLHRRAGSKNICEVHGNITANKCVDCSAPAPENIEIDPDNIPTCRKCGGRLRPDVVWFGEMLDQKVISAAMDAARASEVFLSIGTSAIVHPAAGLPMMAKHAGATLVEINPERTPLTALADFYFAEKSGEFLPGLVAKLRETKGE
ncbi:MAG: NAD-dependent deacylase [bacterium]